MVTSFRKTRITSVELKDLRRRRPTADHREEVTVWMLALASVSDCYLSSVAGAGAQPKFQQEPTV